MRRPSGWCWRPAPSRRSRAIAAIRRRSARRSTTRSCTASRRNRALVGGDIISLDMGVKLDGFYGDSAVTVPVGQVSDDVQRLLRVTQEVAAEGDRAGAAGRPGFGYRPRDSGARRGGGFLGRARVRRARHRRAAARGAADCQLRRAWSRAAAGRRHGARDRADGEHGPAGGEGVARRVDGGDARRQPVGALRAHRRGDEGWPAGVDRTNRRVSWKQRKRCPPS